MLATIQRTWTRMSLKSSRSRSRQRSSTGRKIHCRCCLMSQSSIRSLFCPYSVGLASTHTWSNTRTNQSANSTTLWGDWPNKKNATRWQKKVNSLTSLSTESSVKHWRRISTLSALYTSAKCLQGRRKLSTFPRVWELKSRLENSIMNLASGELGKKTHHPS